MDKIFQWLTDNKSKLMNKFVLNMIPNKRDAEDFYQDLYLIMADKNLSKMTKIYEADEMEQYLYVIIRNNLKSVNSRYYYTYRKPLGIEYINRIKEDKAYVHDRYEFESIQIAPNPEINIVLQELEDDYKSLTGKIEKYLNKQLTENPRSFYNKKVFEMYYNDKNTYRGLSEILDIPHCSIYKTVTNGRLKIVKAFKTEIENINKKIIYYHTL